MANVKIYTTPTCSFCKKAKEFFQSSNIGFEEIDISTSRTDMELLAEKGFMGVPVIAISASGGEEYMQGFDEKVKQRIKEVLGI